MKNETFKKFTLKAYEIFNNKCELIIYGREYKLIGGWLFNSSAIFMLLLIYATIILTVSVMFTIFLLVFVLIIYQFL